MFSPKPIHCFLTVLINAHTVHQPNRLIHIDYDSRLSPTACFSSNVYFFTLLQPPGTFEDEIEPSQSSLPATLWLFFRLMLNSPSSSLSNSWSPQLAPLGLQDFFSLVMGQSGCKLHSSELHRDPHVLRREAPFFPSSNQLFG